MLDGPFPWFGVVEGYNFCIKTCRHNYKHEWYGGFLVLKKGMAFVHVTSLCKINISFKVKMDLY